MKYENKTKAELIKELKTLRKERGESALNEITEYKKTEDALRESERRFRDVTENALEWIWEVDASGKYTYASPVCKKILGYKPEELFEKHFYDLFVPEEQEQLKKTAFKAFANKQPFREFINQNIHKSGKPVWVSTSGVPILDKKGNLLGYRGTDMDITERKQADEALKESQRYTRGLIEANLNALVTISAKGKITDVNIASELITGMSRKEIIGTDFSNYFTVPDAARKGYQQVFRDGYVRDYPLEIKHRDGRVTPVLYNASIYKDAQGSVAGVFASARDITECKKAEKHIKHLNSVLKAIRNVNQLIVKEKDRDRLFRKVCDILVDARGYDAVWFGLLEDGNIINKIASSGFGKDASFFDEQVRGSDQLLCIRNALERKEMVLLVNKSDECGDCSLKDAHADKEVAIIRIEHDGRLFGLLAVSFSPDVVVNEEEKGILKEVASDISFALHNMEEEESRKKAEMETRLLQKLTMVISEARDFKTALNTTLSLTCEHTGWLMGEAWVPNPNETALEYCLGWCDDSDEHGEPLRRFIELSKQFTFPQGVGLPGRVWQSMQPEWQHDVASLSEEIYLRAKPSKKAGLKAALGVPIISNGQVLTVLVFYTTTPQPEDERQIELVLAVATQLGTVILRKKAEERLKKIMNATIETISRIIEAKDPYTSGHQRRVSQLAAPLAQELGLAEDKIEGIRIASLIHDIGKIGIPTEILSKPIRLTDIEFNLIKGHSQIGYDILKSIDFSYPIARIVLQHHEKINGSGYPRGLKGDDILLEARIICVADVVEAMSSHRPYRPALGIDVALEEISKNRGILYDPEIVDICLRLFKEKDFKFEL